MSSRRTTPERNRGSKAADPRVRRSQHDSRVRRTRPVPPAGSRWYNLLVTGLRFEELKPLIGFTPEDERALAELAGRLDDVLPSVAERFYRVLVDNPDTRSVFTGGEEQIRRLHEALTQGLSELFAGVYDAAYFERRAEIGRAHVRAEVPERFVFTSMGLIREELGRHIRSRGIDGAEVKLAALDKLLYLELAVITETYREHFVARIQRIDEARYKRRISEAEHLATIGQLAASLAHEIKNPLAGISAAIQILGADLPPGHPHKEAVGEALRQIDRLDATVRDLLVYARPQAPTRVAHDLREIFDRALILIREEPSFHGISVEFERTDGEVIAEVDEHQMQQVIMNLLLNSAHACGEGGRVRCSLSTDSTHVNIEVEDNGCGMSEETRSRAFEPFYTMKVRGTGLGLPICRRIVESHGGSIRIDSAEQEGTRVAIHLPRYA